MADPALVTCPADTWTLVASSVTEGYVYIKNTQPNTYLQTYRDAGNAAPTDDSTAEYMINPGAPISATAPIDVYIKAVATAGEVLVKQ